MKKSLISLFAVSVVCMFLVGCATDEGAQKESEGLKKDQEIAKTIKKLDTEDPHGVSQESNSGKDYTPGR